MINALDHGEPKRMKIYLVLIICIIKVNIDVIASEHSSLNPNMLKSAVCYQQSIHYYLRYADKPGVHEFLIADQLGSQQFH